MNDHRCFNLLSIEILFSLTLFICIQYDNNISFTQSSIRNSSLWVANLTSLILFLILQRILFRLPMMRMSSEKLNRFCCLLSLVSIWSLLVSLLAVPRPVSVASKLSSALTVPELILLQKCAAAADAKICPLNRKPNCLNPFFKRHVKENPLWWPISVTPIKQLSARKYPLPRSIGSWLATDGARYVLIVQWIKVECYQHKHFGQIVHLCSTARRPDFGLDDSWSQPSRFCSFRSYLCTCGGYC